MTMVLSESMSALTCKIDDIIHSTISSTALLANAISDSLTRIQSENVDFLLEPAVKRTIQEHIKQTLNNNAYCSGAGFASHIASTRENKEFWLLEWWYKKAGGVTQVNLDLDQATQQRLDFRTFEWFKDAPANGKAFIHGPYVDYICNTSYTLTAAVPVYFKDHFLGVAALDILVSRVEEELLPYSDRDPIILTNVDKRIIFSTWPKYRVGDLLMAPDFSPFHQMDYFILYALANRDANKNTGHTL